jgi:hypothetical protein
LRHSFGAFLPCEPCHKVRSSTIAEYGHSESLNPPDDWVKSPAKFLIPFIPISCVLFRPEQIHAASPKRLIGFLHPQPTSGVSDDSFRFRQKQLSVPHFEMQRRITEQTRSVNMHDLSREKPGARQCLETTLGKPTLSPVNCYSVWSRLVIERRE